MPHIFRRVCQCIRPTCGFRFMYADDQSMDNHCPKCGSPLKVKDLIAPVPESGSTFDFNLTLIIEVLLDNIRSAYNVGSILRTADGIGVKHIHLCGITPTPDHPQVIKTSLGAESVLPWSQHWNSLCPAVDLKEKGYTIWALECSPNAQPLHKVLTDLTQAPLLLIAGNEITGVDPDLLAYCDRTVYIPMSGIKRSLNVAIALSIALYLIRLST